MYLDSVRDVAQNVVKATSHLNVDEMSRYLNRHCTGLDAAYLLGQVG